MADRKSGIGTSLAGLTLPGGSLAEPRHLLNALFKSSTVGVGICDRQLRFRAVNDALASMNGLPAHAHLGKTIHAVLGSAAEKVQPAFDHVFATGQPLSNFEVRAELPTRKGMGHWSESYFPIKDQTGAVFHVGAVVLELTQKSEIDASLARIANQLAHLASELRERQADSEPLCELCKDSQDAQMRFTALLDGCYAETRALRRLLHNAPLLATVQPIAHRQHSQLPLEIDFAYAEPVGDDAELGGTLSSREREVTALLAMGRSNKEIASKLEISIRTVESHRAKIMLKLDIHSLSDLVRYAVRTHLINA
jgi:DNA-binding CsgD family transcriptional regulator